MLVTVGVYILERADGFLCMIETPSCVSKQAARNFTLQVHTD